MTLTVENRKIVSVADARQMVAQGMTRHIKENEQGKEAEVVRLRTPPRKIWIDLMTGTICDPEPIEHGGHVIPFTVPRSGLRGKGK